MPTLSTHAIIARVRKLRDAIGAQKLPGANHRLMLQAFRDLGEVADALEAAHQETEQKQDFTRVDESSPIAPGRATAAQD
jgi:hypothetical protein